MSEDGIKIKSVGVAERCDVCHKSDLFDPETRFCLRCKQIAQSKSIEQPLTQTAPPPEFLLRRFSSNVPVRCSNCGEFIMSRSLACRHCGTYLPLQEMAQATLNERKLTEAFERLHQCKAASSLSWEFLR